MVYYVVNCKANPDISGYYHTRRLCKYARNVVKASLRKETGIRLNNRKVSVIEYPPTHNMN